jgi:rRNA maturation endonuclease Nob1
MNGIYYLYLQMDKCSNCGTGLNGKFCHNCGQGRVKRLEVKSMVHDVNFPQPASEAGANCK